MTALIAWGLFDETLTPPVFAGMVLAVTGVALVVRVVPAPARPAAT